MSAADRVREQAIEEYDVLGASPRRELLALTELAARCSGLPSATINLVTATQRWQVAPHGFAGAVCAREEAMCHVVLQEGHPVLVGDATADARFADNPFVTGELGTIRCYAAHPLTTPDGVVIGTLSVFDDDPHPVDPGLGATLATLAERVVDALQLEPTSRRLSACHERLRAFAGQVSHDLKNPLAAIRMSVELARDEAVDDGLAQLLERAERGAQRMDAMIGELHAFAHAGGGSDLVDVDLRAELDAVLEDLGAASGQVAAEGLPVLRGDRAELRTVLRHLVDNAVKFSEPGSQVRVTGERLEAGWWVGVADGGPGIPPEDRERAFEPMVRLDRRKPGNGIGLTTSRRIVGAHGGRMGITDNPGGGTLVWFELPD